MSRISEVMSWLESRAFVKILGGGNLHSGLHQQFTGSFHGVGHVRKAVNALARHGDLLKVGGEERHDACARLFTFVRRGKDGWIVPRQSVCGWILFLF